MPTTAHKELDMPADRLALTPAAYDQLREAYLFVFNNFAIGKSDLAEFLGIDKRKATALLHNLEGRGLVYSTDVNDAAQGDYRRGRYAELTWQSAVVSIDNTDEDGAKVEFEKEYEVKGSRKDDKPAKPARKPRAAKPKTARAKPASKGKGSPKGILAADIAREHDLDPKAFRRWLRRNDATIESRRQGAKLARRFSDR